MSRKRNTKFTCSLTALVVAAAMSCTFSGCDKKSDTIAAEPIIVNPGPPERSEEDYYELLKSFEFDFDDVKFGENPISTDIPETAVIKKTISYHSTDYLNSRTDDDIIIYCDEYDNELLKLESSRGGDYKPVYRYIYEYDENGNKIMENYIDDETERFVKYQYYENGRVVVYEEFTDEGKRLSRDYTEYDEYGNMIFNCRASYDWFGEENELKDSPWFMEMRNIKYDSNGNILSYDNYNFNNEQPKSSFVMTYDDKNRLLTREEYFTEHEKSYYDYCEKYECSYEGDCDKASCIIMTEMDTPDHIERVVTEKFKYDKKERNVYYEMTNSEHDNVIRKTETEYEELK